MKVQGRKHSDSALTLLDGGGFYLFHLWKLNNWFTLRDYAYCLVADRGTFVSKAVIGKWFLTTFPFKGRLKKLNQIPIDKFTDNNILRWVEFIDCLGQIPPWFILFRDEKPPKGGELFNCRGHANPLTGLVEDFVIDSDWHNTYAITSLCWIGRDRPPFSYIVHDGSNNASVFCDFIIQNLPSVFYSQYISLCWTMRQSSISRRRWSLIPTFGTIAEYFSSSCSRTPQNWILLSCCGTSWCSDWSISPLSDNYGSCMHQVAQAAKIIMNEFTHEDVDACYRYCGYIWVLCNMFIENAYSAYS